MAVTNTDKIATPYALELLACLQAQLATLGPDAPARIELRVGGEEVGPLIGPDADECCAGLAWVRVANEYPSWNNFPAPDTDWSPCGPLAYAVVLEMGVAACMPWMDSSGTIDDMNPPSTADWRAAFDLQMQHKNLMRKAATCCFPPTVRRVVGQWTPLTTESGCTGGKMQVTVSVMPPCFDCQ